MPPTASTPPPHHTQLRTVETGTYWLLQSGLQYATDPHETQHGTEANATGHMPPQLQLRASLSHTYSPSRPYTETGGRRAGGAPSTAPHAAPRPGSSHRTKSGERWLPRGVARLCEGGRHGRRSLVIYNSLCIPIRILNSHLTNVITFCG